MPDGSTAAPATLNEILERIEERLNRSEIGEALELIALAKRANARDLTLELQVAQARLNGVDDVIAVVALALRGQGDDEDCACASVLEGPAYAELEQARDALSNALRRLGVQETADEVS